MIYEINLLSFVVIYATQISKAEVGKGRTMCTAD